MNTNMTGFRWLSKIFGPRAYNGMKVASALEGLREGILEGFLKGQGLIPQLLKLLIS